jgi:acyl-coenzyme A thioesterase PaaI-like protein
LPGQQPNSAHCFVCGLKNPYGLRLIFYQTRPGEVTAEVTVPDKFQGFPGIVHGGVVAALLDETLGRVLIGVDPDSPRFLYTAKMDVRYRKHAPIGEPLRLLGRLGKERPAFITSSASLHNMAGEILAEAEGLMVDVPPEVFEGVDMALAGWRIYAEQDELEESGLT